MKFFFFEKIS